MSHNVPRLSDVPKDENEVFRFRNVAKRQISAVARCAPRARVQQRVARPVAQNARRILRNVSVYAMFFARFHFFMNRKGLKIWVKELRGRCLF